MKYLVRNNSLEKLDEKVTAQRFAEWTHEMRQLLKQQVAKIREIESRK